MRSHNIVHFDDGSYSLAVKWLTMFAGVEGEPVSAPGEGWFLVDGEFDGGEVVIEQSADGEVWSELVRIDAKSITDRIACTGLVRPRVDGGDILTALDVFWVKAR